MATKFLDSNGLLYVWNKIKNLLSNKVDKIDGKTLTSNDYTTEEKTKLAGLSNIEIVDTLTSTSKTSALSANQGKVLNDEIKSVKESMSDLGYGDMMKSAYDTNNSGVVDDSEKLGGHLPDYYAKKTDIPASANDINAVPNTRKVNGKVLNADITLSAGDVGAATISDISSATGSTLQSAKDYTDNSLSSYYNKTEIDGKISSVYKYKGSIPTYAELPNENLSIGDVYNVESASENNKAGDNLAWNGEAWDNLSGIVDLSAYLKTTDIGAITNGEIDSICTTA